MKKKGHTDSNDWVSLRQSGKRLSPPVEWQAVQQWIKEGFGGWKKVGRNVLVNVPALIAWRAKYRRDPDEPGHGGRRTPEATDLEFDDQAGDEGGQQELPFRPVALTEEEIDRRNARGQLTSVDLDQTLDTIKVKDAIREHRRRAGELLDTKECEQAWAELLQNLKDNLDEVPALSETDACAELALTNTQGRRLREIMQERMREALAAMLTSWKPPPQPPPKKRR